MPWFRKAAPNGNFPPAPPKKHCDLIERQRAATRRMHRIKLAREILVARARAGQYARPDSPRAIVDDAYRIADEFLDRADDE